MLIAATLSLQQEFSRAESTLRLRDFMEHKPLLQK